MAGEWIHEQIRLNQEKIAARRAMTPLQRAIERDFARRQQEFKRESRRIKREAREKAEAEIAALKKKLRV